MNIGKLQEQVSMTMLMFLHGHNPAPLGMYERNPFNCWTQELVTGAKVLSIIQCCFVFEEPCGTWLFFGPKPSQGYAPTVVLFPFRSQWYKCALLYSGSFPASNRMDGLAMTF